ncbi:MAG: hypothetical protein EXQ49_09550, partial [Acidobacteria bacterium]|nr:hypothetical protein [Acidobacteriota bacterium]
MADTAGSRRVSEITGVALFAVMIIWLIALMSYTPTDPTWFFNNGTGTDVVNFAGRIGAFVAELSFQLFGYAAYLIPAALCIVGWRSFWCHKVDAAYTKLVGGGLFSLCTAALLSLAFDVFAPSVRPFAAGGVVGEVLSSVLVAYLARTGAVVLLIALMALSVILATQFSFGRASEAAAGAVRERSTGLWAGFQARQAERRRVKERQHIVDKHVKQAGRDKAPEIAIKA